MLRRWTAFHEEWEEEVGAVAVDGSDGLLFFDPIEPPADLGAPDHTFLTVFFHARSATGRVWAPRSLVKRLANRGVEVTDPFEPGDLLPGGVECIPTARSGEVVYWIPSEQALVVGDVLLGAGAKPRPTDDALRLCPERWIGGGKTHDDLRESLRPLLDLPVEQVLPSHGEPVLSRGRAALAALLGVLVLALAGCGGGSDEAAQPKPEVCPRTVKAMAKLTHDVAVLKAAKPGHATDVATDKFLLDVATLPVSNLQRNRMIDHAAAVVFSKCEQCFQALEAARPIPSIRAGESGCPSA